MRIIHNISSLNTYNKLNKNKSASNKAIEKLSSGYKINRAGDDSAGLAISEKMRGQIRGLNMASKNIQDGISLIQTAEGGFQEITNIIQRQRELIIQGSNDTNTENDKLIIENEIKRLTEEIDSIANKTEFNTINLLNRSDYQILENRSSHTVDVNTTGPFPSTVINNNTYTYFLPADTTEIPITVETTGPVTSHSDAYNHDTSITVITLQDGRQGFNDYEKNEHIHSETSTTYEQTTGRTKYNEPGYKELAIKSSSVSEVLFQTTFIPNATVNGEYPDFGGFNDRTIFIEIDGVQQTLHDFTLLSSSANTNSISAIYNKDGIEIEKIVSTDGTSFKAEFKVRNTLGNDNTQVKISTNFEPKYSAFYSLSAYTGTPTGETALGAEIPDSGKVFKLYNDLIDYDFSFLSGGNYVKPSSLTTGNLIGWSTGSIIPSWESNNFNIGDTLEFGIQLDSFNFKKDVFLLTDKLTSTVDSVVQTITTDIKDVDYIPPKLEIQMGANENQHTSIPLFSVKADDLGINNLGILPPANPDESLSKLDKGLEKVTNFRSTYGAIQNRLEHAYNSVLNTSENLQSAESRIRDTDMAKEMMIFTKDKILMQTAQAMLANSNQQPQSILQLLQ